MKKKAVNIIFLLIGFLLAQLSHPHIPIDTTDVVKCKTCQDVSIEMKIREQANKYGVDPDVAMRIAICESRLDPFAENNSSSASGLYQFIDKTWDNYCTGNVFNEDDNIECFMELYPTYKSWWECK